MTFFLVFLRDAIFCMQQMYRILPDQLSQYYGGYGVNYI